MAQMTLILAAAIISLGYLQFVADAQLPIEKNMQLEPISVPPVSPDEVQQIDFSGEVNAILEEKMQLNPQITSNGSSNEQKQLKLPANTSIAIPEEKQVTLIAANNTTSSNMTSNNVTHNNVTSNNVTLVEKRPLQSTNKKTNSDIYSISIYNSSNLSEFLADGNSTALYYFKGDLRGNGISSCTGACLNVWRPFYTPVITVMPGLNQSDFTIFTSTNNIKQIAYEGWPLYHYINDTMPGDAKGQGFDRAWFVVDPRNFPPR